MCAPAHLALGVELVARGEAFGLEHLSHAMAADEDTAALACRVAIRHLRGTERGDEAAPYEERLAARLDLLSAATRERNETSLGDGFEAHVLVAEAVENIVAALEALPEVRRAYLVRQRVERLDDEHPCHVLLVEPWRRWHQVWQEAYHREESLARRLVCAIDADITVVVPGALHPLARRLPSFVDALIYESTDRYTPPSPLPRFG